MPRPTGQCFICFCARNGQRAHRYNCGEIGVEIVLVPNDPIRKLYLINAITVDRAGVEVRADAQGFVAVLDLDNQIIRLTTYHYVRNIQPLKTNDIQLADRGVVIGVITDGVLARAFAEHIGVGAETTVQRIIAAASIK